MQSAGAAFATAHDTVQNNITAAGASSVASHSHCLSASLFDDQSAFICQQHFLKEPETGKFDVLIWYLVQNLAFLALH